MAMAKALALVESKSHAVRAENVHLGKQLATLTILREMDINKFIVCKQDLLEQLKDSEGELERWKKEFAIAEEDVLYWKSAVATMTEESELWEEEKNYWKETANYWRKKALANENCS
jgi:hypothetical protein